MFICQVMLLLGHMTNKQPKSQMKLRYKERLFGGCKLELEVFWEEGDKKRERSDLGFGYISLLGFGELLYKKGGRGRGKPTIN